MFKPVLKQSEAQGQILSYQPRTLNQEVPEQVLTFARDPQQVENTPSEFAINSLTAQTTGLSALDQKSFQDKVEAEVLSRLKVIEEKAFSEAYALGMLDGKTKGFADAAAEIKQALENLGKMIQTISEIKQQIFIENEGHFVKTIYHLAKAIALKEIKEDPGQIINVMRKALENAQSEEEIIIRVSRQDSVFLESIKKEMGNPFERITKLKVEASEAISPGGCLIETNYGVIDATIEQRLEKLFVLLDSKIPKTAEG